MKKLILRQIIMLSKWTFYGLIFNVFTFGTLWANMLNAQEIKSIKEISIHLKTRNPKIVQFLSINFIQMV